MRSLLTCYFYTDGFYSVRSVFWNFDCISNDFSEFYPIEKSKSVSIIMTIANGLEMQSLISVLLNFNQSLYLLV